MNLGKSLKSRHKTGFQRAGNLPSNPRKFLKWSIRHCFKSESHAHHENVRNYEELVKSE